MQRAATPATPHTAPPGAPNAGSQSTVVTIVVQNEDAEDILRAEERFDEYDKKIEVTKWCAVIRGGIFGLNWFLGLCALTWATVIILGGMVSTIRERDYNSVAILLILEAVRLATARFVNFYATKHVIPGSADPTKLVYSDYREIGAQEICHSIGQIFELMVLSLSMALPFSRLVDQLHYEKDEACAHPDSPSCDFNALVKSLWIFYVLVFSNAFIAAAAVIYSKIILYVFVEEPSYALCRYYRSIVWNSIDKGFLNGTDLDILQFAFELQAAEYKNNKRAITVMKMYGDLMEYLYNYPHHKGFEAAKVELDSSDVFRREAAANIVGCWLSIAGRHTGRDQGKKLLLQGTLLSKLADALDHEETGRAATSSFEQMASRSPKLTVEVRNSGGERLVDILTNRIHQVVVQKLYDKAIVFIKVLIKLIDSKEIKLIDSQEVGNQIVSCSCSGSGPSTFDKLDTLVEDLRSIVLGYRTLPVARPSIFDTLLKDLRSIVEGCSYTRTLAVASYALLELLHKNGILSSSKVMTFEEAKDAIRYRLDVRNQHQPINSQVLAHNSQDEDQANNAENQAHKSQDQDRANNVENQANNGQHQDQVSISLRSKLSKGCQKLRKGCIELLPCQFVPFLLNTILDVAIGKDPKMNKKKEHILRDEKDYLIKVLETINKDHNRTLRRYQFEELANELEVWDVDKKVEWKPPKWIKNIKTTTYIVALSMVILTILTFTLFVIFKFPL